MMVNSKNNAQPLPYGRSLVGVTSEGAAAPLFKVVSDFFKVDSLIWFHEMTKDIEV
jgi:hypothetical protein